jgi:hypothetical protein
MTELECVRHQYFLMKKMAYELQSTLHQLSNNIFNDRHRGSIEECTDETCKLFRKAYYDIERLPNDIERT